MTRSPDWRDDPDIKAATAHASEMMARMWQHGAVRDAELVLAGLYPACVSHGEAEDHHDAHLIYDVLGGLADSIGHVKSSQMGHGWTTWYYDGPHAAECALSLCIAVRLGQLPPDAREGLAAEIDADLGPGGAAWVRAGSRQLGGAQFPHWWKAAESASPPG